MQQVRSTQPEITGLMQLESWGDLYAAAGQELTDCVFSLTHCRSDRFAPELRELEENQRVSSARSWIAC